MTHLRRLILAGAAVLTLAGAAACDSPNPTSGDSGGQPHGSANATGTVSTSHGEATTGKQVGNGGGTGYGNPGETGTAANGAVGSSGG